MKRFFAICMICVLLLCGCGEEKKGKGDQKGSQAVESSETLEITDGSSESGEETTKESSETIEVDFTTTDEDMFTKRDSRTTYEDVQATISLNGISAACDSPAVQIDGSTITITDEGTYIVEGTLDDGMIIVNAEETDKPQIVLKGTSITSSTSASIYILEADKVFITLEADTENTLTNGGSFEAIDENNIDAVIFSKQDLTLNGEGTLTVNSPVGHGIVSKDDLVLTGGTYVVTSASHGMDANDSVRVANADISIAAGKDGIHAENSDDAAKGFVYIESGTFDISAEGDGISAGAYMQIKDGVFNLLTGGGSENGTKQTSDSWGMMGGGKGPGGMGGFGGKGGMGGPGGFGGQSTVESTEEDENSTSIKGLKAAGSMSVEGGTFTIDSADDAIHSNTSITIDGGNFEIATGDDGVHADEALTINDCVMNISESYEGLEALDITLNGGDIMLVASDDGLNAAGGTDSSGTGGRGGDMFGPGMMGGGPGGMSVGNGSILIRGGNLYMEASGDGIDANGYIEMTGGYVVVCGPNMGDTATLDYDTTASISGGTFIGTGASGMAQTFSDSNQGVIACSVGGQSAGTNIVLKDASGETLIEYTPQLDYAVFIYSAESIVKGETYTITIGELSGDVEAY